MAIDYREVLKELRAEEERLQKEIDIVRGALPAMEIMAAKMPQAVRDWIKSDSRPYETMGTKAAIGALLLNTTKPLMPADIAKHLLDGGLQTKSGDFVGTVTSTLNQMKADNLVVRVEDGWIVRKGGVTMPPIRNPLVIPQNSSPTEFDSLS